MKNLVLDMNTNKVLNLCEEKYNVKYNKEGKDINVEVLNNNHLVAGFSLFNDNAYALDFNMIKAILFLIA